MKYKSYRKTQIVKVKLGSLYKMKLIYNYSNYDECFFQV